MEITDNDLCVLEQLTYITPGVGKAAGVTSFVGIKYTEGKTITVGEILASFDETSLNTLRAQGDKLVGEGEISAEEWAKIQEKAGTKAWFR